MKRSDRKLVKLTPVRLSYLENGSGPIYLRHDSAPKKPTLETVADRIRQYEAEHAAHQ